MRLLQTIRVLHHKRAVRDINELELVREGEKEYIYANVYTKNDVIKIDKDSGHVVKVFNMEELEKN